MPKPKKTMFVGGTCKNGHVLTEENTYVVKTTGYVHCKNCQLDYQRTRRDANWKLRKEADNDLGNHNLR